MRGQPKVALRVVTIAVGAALLASGCRTDREVTTPKPKPVTEARLAAALLAEDDLPATFTAAADGTPIDTEVIEQHSCDDALADLDPKLQATADFTGSGTRLTSTVAWFPGGGSAVERLFRDVANDCAAVVVADQGLSLLTSELDFGVLSDDTFPLKFQLEQADGTIEERDLILMRQGDLVGLVRLTGTRPSDKVLLDQAVRVAIGRLAFLAQETS